MKDIRFLSKPRYSNSRGLVIGINKYKHASPLSYAVNDAEGVREVLVNHLGFQPQDVILLKDSDATRQNILKAFLNFSLDHVELDERIVLFFAGHGHTRTGVRGEVGYLVPYDAEMSDLSTLIRWDELTRNAELIRAKHMLFIMDACYGGLALTRTLEAGSARFLKDMLRRYARQVLTAGKADEVVADSGGPLAGHSVFTGHLIQGLKGGAASEHGVISASGLMAYVHGKVANDNHSNQTPHYGYFDGDGDFIISAPQLLEQGNQDDKKGTDELFLVPLVEGEECSTDSLKVKVSTAKRLLSADSSNIELHDLMIEELKRFLSESTEDHFTVQGGWSTGELLERMAKYETISTNLCALIACLSYWGKPAHEQILKKVLARSTDRLESRAGLVVWSNLRWYPLILEMYFAGIAAIAGQRYDSLANVFHTRVTSFADGSAKEQYFVESVVSAALHLQSSGVFKQLPGHEQHYTPLSEYLFTLLQPKLDDILFIGRDYESAFDEFEVLLALVIADIRKQRGGRAWGPIGRFGWKHIRGEGSPLAKVIKSAETEQERWAPLKSGFFGSSLDRFLGIANAYMAETISKLPWW